MQTLWLGCRDCLKKGLHTQLSYKSDVRTVVDFCSWKLNLLIITIVAKENRLCKNVNIKQGKTFLQANIIYRKKYSLKNLITEKRFCS